MTSNLTPAETDWKAIPGADGQPVRAFSHRLVSGREERPHRVAVWRGEPGTYRRDNGMPWSEVFAVYKGTGSISFDSETIELRPGAIVDLPVGKPYVMEVVTTIEKIAVITET